MTECNATMQSQAVPEHTHTCSGKHVTFQYHYCGDCGRWWWKA